MLSTSTPNAILPELPESVGRANSVEEYAEFLKANAITLPTTRIEQMEDGRYRVLWEGRWFGGVFVHWVDAAFLADWAENQNDDDRLGWIAMGKALS